MAVAYDTSTTKGETTGDSTWSHTAGAANIQGALVYIVIRASNTPPVGVTYGGATMAKVTEANDTANETGNTTAWFLANPGNGTKTVSVDVGAAQVWVGAAITCTGAAALKTYVGTPAQENQANPSSTIAVPAGYVNYPSGAYFYGAVNSGVTAGAGFSKFGAVDFTGGGVTSSGSFERYTTGTVTGNPAVAFTAGSDDCAMVAVTMGEPVVVAQAVDATTTVATTGMLRRTTAKAVASTSTVGAVLLKRTPTRITAGATLTAALTTRSTFVRAIAATTSVGAALSRLIGKPVASTATLEAVLDAVEQGGATQYPVTIAIAGTPEGWVGT